MGKGGYLGGSSTLGRNSEWFAKGRRDGDGRLLKEENLKVERLKYGIEIITSPQRRRRKTKKSAPASS